MHTEDVDEAASLLYSPVVQVVHALLPVTSALYAPVAHAVHTVDVVAAATLEYVPAPQPVQPAVPVVSVL